MAKTLAPSSSSSSSSSNGAKIRTNALSQLLQRAKLALYAGLQFGGKRDLYETFGYKKLLVSEDFRTKFVRQDIARRIVIAPAAATWRRGLKIEGTPAIKDAWEKLNREKNIIKALESADKIAGLGHYSVLLWGVQSSGSLENPLRQRNSGGLRPPSELLYAQTYSEPNAEILSLEDNPSSERFGLPGFYRLKSKDPAKANVGSLKDLKVHHSRVIHIAEDAFEDRIYGTPRLEAVFNLLDDLLKVAGGSAETYWLTSNRGIQANIDKEMELDPEDEAALSAELEEYQHDLRRIVRTRGVDLKPLNSPMANPEQTFKVIISLISGATGIPQRILLGSEAGQLASDQDRANWADRVTERRDDFADPVILRPALKFLTEAGFLPPDTMERVKIKWPEPFVMSPLERAQEMAQKGRTIVNLSRQAKEGFPIATQEECRDILGLPPEPEPGMGELPDPAQPNGPKDDPAPAEGDDDDDEGEDGAPANLQGSTG